MTEPEWRQQLKVGDEVAVLGSLRAITLMQVTKITPTQICVGSTRFRKDTGRLVGATAWRSLYITPVTDDHRETLRRQKAIHGLTAFRLTNDTPTENIENAVKALKGET